MERRRGIGKSQSPARLVRRGAVILALALLSLPFTALAQEPGKVARLGLLVFSAPELAVRSVAAVREGLGDAGWHEGQNIRFESRYASGKREQLGTLAANLVHQNVDVIVAFGTDATRAARGATSSIPVVMAAASDPVASGFAKSLARPGGNVTGLSLQMPDLVGKQLQLLKETAPKASRIGVISLSASAQMMTEAEAAARHHGVTLHRIVLREPLTLDDLAPQLRTARVDAVLGAANPALDDVRIRIVEIVNAHRLPSVFNLTYWAETGGLMSYSADIYALQRRAAVYVDKILKGTNPANLPIEQPTKFELVFNLKTAKAIGLTMPHSLLQRADRIIQ
jgi:putative tryptophan/tyrosine transport system substrate-binding protein